MNGVPDVLVIGGGAAGVAAALAARDAGAGVLVVRAGPGASALAGGGWRGTVPEPFARALEAAGHALLPAADPLADAAGVLARFGLAPPWHAGATADDTTLVCGIAGLPTFHAPYLARAWGCAAGVTLSLPDTPAGGWSPVALAAAVERAPERLGEAVGAAARERAAARVIVPAVLGLDDPQACWRAAAAAAGFPLAEALGGRPSIPGWRLDRALLRALAAAGVVLRAGRVAGADLAAGRVTRIRLESGDELRPGSIVLATGKFSGGGIVADPTLREPALDLPVWIDHMGERFREASPLLTTALARGGDQPLLAAGVRSEGRRPVDPAGVVLAANVLVAGSVRAGRETVAWGLGDVASDGWWAGVMAAGGVPESPDGRPAAQVGPTAPGDETPPDRAPGQPAEARAAAQPGPHPERKP